MAEDASPLDTSPAGLVINLSIPEQGEPDKLPSSASNSPDSSTMELPVQVPLSTVRLRQSVTHPSTPTTTSFQPISLPPAARHPSPALPPPSELQVSPPSGAPPGIGNFTWEQTIYMVHNPMLEEEQAGPRPQLQPPPVMLEQREDLLCPVEQHPGLTLLQARDSLCCLPEPHPVRRMENPGLVPVVSPVGEVPSCATAHTHALLVAAGAGPPLQTAPDTPTALASPTGAAGAAHGGPALSSTAISLMEKAAAGSLTPASHAHVAASLPLLPAGRQARGAGGLPPVCAVDPPLPQWGREPEIQPSARRESEGSAMSDSNSSMNSNSHFDVAAPPQLEAISSYLMDDYAKFPSPIFAEDPLPLSELLDSQEWDLMPVTPSGLTTMAHQHTPVAPPPSPHLQTVPSSMAQVGVPLQQQQQPGPSFARKQQHQQFPLQAAMTHPHVTGRFPPSYSAGHGVNCPLHMPSFISGSDQRQMSSGGPASSMPRPHPTLLPSSKEQRFNGHTYRVPRTTAFL